LLEPAGTTPSVASPKASAVASSLTRLARDPGLDAIVNEPVPAFRQLAMQGAPHAQAAGRRRIGPMCASRCARVAYLDGRPDLVPREAPPATGFSTPTPGRPCAAPGTARSTICPCQHHCPRLMALARRTLYFKILISRTAATRPPGLALSGRQSVLPEPDSDGFDVELVLDPVQHFIADYALIPKPDHHAALRDQRLVPEPSLGRRGFG
jgi:hypothetical protein